MWFTEDKRKVFATEIAASSRPAQWERKGSSIFREATLQNCPQQISKHLLVMMDQVNEKQRLDRMPTMYAHMFSRSGEFEEMKRIVEPPMHLDSAVSANIQFADWVAACVSRAVDYQLIERSDFGWITGNAVDAVRGSFTHESKLHLCQRSVSDIHHSDPFKRERPLFPKIVGQRVGDSIPPDALRKLKAAAERPRLGASGSG